MNEKIKSILLAFVIVLILVMGVVAYMFDHTPAKITNMSTDIIEEPKAIVEKVTLRTFQGGWPQVIYATEYYIEDGLLHIKDRKKGYMTTTFGDDCLIIPGWVEDEKELSKYGVVYLENEFGLGN